MSKSRTIAVAVDTPDGLDATVSNHFGHCVGFVLVDVEGEKIIGARTEANPFAQGHQPGQLPTLMREFGANVLLAGGMGQRAQSILSQFGIDVSTGARGRVRDAVESYVRGDLGGFTPCSENEHGSGHGGHHAHHSD